MRHSKVCLNIQNFFFIRLPTSIQNFNRSPWTTKFSIVHCIASVMFLIHGGCSIYLYTRMLDPSPSSFFFDFRATAVKESQLRIGSCSIMSLKWSDFFYHFNAFLANYVLLCFFVLCAGLFSCILSSVSFILYFGYNRFGTIPSYRYRRPTTLDQVYGLICKLFTFALNYMTIGLMVLVFLPLFFTFSLNICRAKWVGLSRPEIRIFNCREWVSLCIKDKRFYGRHLQCSLEENFSAFPDHECDHFGENPCTFPITHSTSEIDASASTTFLKHIPSTVTIKGPICLGETISHDEGGPVPWCPMCNEARESLEPVPKTYDTAFLASPNDNFLSWVPHTGERQDTIQTSPGPLVSFKKTLLEEGTKPVSTSEALSVPKTFTPKKRLIKITETLDTFFGPRSPKILKDTVSQAFDLAYFRTLQYFQQASHVSRVLYIWSLLSLNFLLGYFCLLNFFNQLLLLDGGLRLCNYGSKTSFWTVVKRKFDHSS